MKRIAILLLCAVLLLFLFINSWKSVRGTICDFDEKTGSMTVVAEDGQKYIVNDYLKHIPTGEEWNIGDVVKIVYRGSIQETSPAVIEKESAIAVVDRGKVEMLCFLCLVLSPSREASAREFKCP
jgi:hypothetical protein